MRVVGHRPSRASHRVVALPDEGIDSFLEFFHRRGSVRRRVVSRRLHLLDGPFGHLQERSLGLSRGVLEFVGVAGERSFELRLVRLTHSSHLGANLLGRSRLSVERRLLGLHLGRVRREEVLGLLLVTRGQISGCIQKFLVVRLDLGVKLVAGVLGFVLELPFEVIAERIRGCHHRLELLGSLRAGLLDRGLRGILRGPRGGVGLGSLFGHGRLEPRPLLLEGRRGGGFGG